MCIIRRGAPLLHSTQRMDLFQQNTWNVGANPAQEDISMVITLIKLILALLMRIRPSNTMKKIALSLRLVSKGGLNKLFSL